MRAVITRGARVAYHAVMALRNIIRIDEALCDGCGECVPSCAEGALQVIDGKARLVKVGIRGAILADSEV